MKRVLAVIGAATVSVVSLATVVSFAQTQTQSVVVKQRVAQTPDGQPPPPPDNFVFIASEVNFGGKVVKGAPYSAQGVTETVQTLGDGNRIVNKVTSAQYRDGEGRTRRETTIKLLGPLSDTKEPMQTIFISDPVAGVTYSLNSQSHVAHKSSPFKGTWIGTGNVGTGNGAGSNAQTFEFRVEGAQGGAVMMKSPSDLPPPPAGVATAAGHPIRIETQSAVGTNYVFRHGGPNSNEVKEQLGKQSFDGVEAEGTRYTVTIPAGEIGNEREIQIVSERWYSPELQLDVMTRHSDPRTGETTYRLTNISRSEPDKTLFEVPAGYTIKEGFGGGVMPMIKQKSKPE